MNVFIDTNVLLDFFRMSSGDLEEIRKVARLSANNRITLLINDFILDEFTRNREGVIAKSISEFNKSKIELHRPNIIRGHAESLELEQIQKRFKELVKILSDRAVTEAHSISTKADLVIGELFESATINKVIDPIIGKAFQRVSLGRPPGKEGSHGDAIHWEWLLHHVPKGEDLYLISRDGDFESHISEGLLASYLQSEWKSTKESQCTLYRSLADFLNEHFADIKLADEIDKYITIERLERSPNFATTHNAIKDLIGIDDYTPTELQKIINAYLSNNQINWIIGDDDVKAFADKIVTLAYANGLINEVLPLEFMLKELEKRMNP